MEAGDVAQLPECLLSMHTALGSVSSSNLSVVVHADNPSVGRWRQENQNPQVILGSIVSLRPNWAT